MNVHPSLPDYDRIADAIVAYHPAELHGMLCGMLCISPEVTRAEWLAQVQLDTAEFAVRDELALTALFDAAVAQLNDDDFVFALVLPDDEMNMSVRAAALGYWCQGFMAGLGLSGLRQDAPMSADVKELLDDISQIARVGFDGDRPDEEDEVAYSEIVEYLRMGILLVNRELCPATPAPRASSTVH